MFEHFHAHHDIEVTGLAGRQVFDGNFFVLGRNAAFEGVQPRHLQGLVGQVHAQGAGRAAAGQGLGEDAAAAAHVHDVQAREAATGLLDDPAQPQRVDVVQGLEFAVGVPPARGENLELVQFGLVDVGAAGRGGGQGCHGVGVVMGWGGVRVRARPVVAGLECRPWRPAWTEGRSRVTAAVVGILRRVVAWAVCAARRFMSGQATKKPPRCYP